MKFTCRVADLADATIRAARVSPMRGVAFDSCQGVRFSCVDAELFIEATNLETTYRQRIPTSECEGETVRLASGIISKFLTQLDMDSEVELEVLGDGKVQLVSNRTRCLLFPLVDPDGQWPIFPDVSGIELVEVADFATALKQVSWACHRNKPPINGVRLDGTKIIACDGTRIAEVPLAMTGDPVTVLVDTAAPILTKGAEVMVASIDEGRKLLIRPDPDTEITVLVLAEDYPKVDFIRKLVEDTTHTIHLPIVELQSALARMLVIAATEQLPYVKLMFGVKSLKMEIVVADSGAMQEEVVYAAPLDGSVPTVAHEVYFTVDYMVKAAAAAEGVTLMFQIQWGTPLTAVRMFDGLGLSVVAMPRRVV